MRYGVIGSRTFTDYSIVKSVLDKHIISQIVSGGAIGADSLASKYAVDHNISLLEFLPNYKKYGKKAPFVRNKLIVQSSEIIIAFWDMTSPGTKHSLEYARSKHIKCFIIDSNCIYRKYK